jgi:hypothetical protein
MDTNKSFLTIQVALYATTQFYLGKKIGCKMNLFLLLIKHEELLAICASNPKIIAYYFYRRSRS